MAELEETTQRRQNKMAPQGPYLEALVAQGIDLASLVAEACERGSPSSRHITLLVGSQKITLHRATATEIIRGGEKETGIRGNEVALLILAAQALDRNDTSNKLAFIEEMTTVGTRPDVRTRTLLGTYKSAGYTGTITTELALQDTKMVRSILRCLRIAFVMEYKGGLLSRVTLAAFYQTVQDHYEENKRPPSQDQSPFRLSEFDGARSSGNPALFYQRTYELVSSMRAIASLAPYEMSLWKEFFTEVRTVTSLDKIVLSGIVARKPFTTIAADIIEKTGISLGEKSLALALADYTKILLLPMHVLQL